MSEETVANTEADVQEEVKLDLKDLHSTLQIIEAASDRGAFQANELSQVGGVYDRIRAFLETTPYWTKLQEAVAAQQAAAQAATEKTEAAEPVIEA